MRRAGVELLLEVLQVLWRMSGVGRGLRHSSVRRRQAAANDSQVEILFCFQNALMTVEYFRVLETQSKAFQV
jgi:hypothetical protein